MPKIFIVRHGQDTDNVKKILNGHHDTDLTDLGREQVKETAQKLESEYVDKAYVSPLKRCQQTAQIITEELKLPEAEVLPDLIERSFGVFTEKPSSDIRKMTDDFLAADQVDYFLSGEGVETFPDTYGRAQSLLEFVEHKHPNENILLVTHGDIGKMLRAAFYGWTWQEGLLTPYLANAEIIILER
ncbi:MAG: histidine phosphatase family protein [Candidatus Buchananbacteria bacterium]|jgi:broad specificity phosphatase PhoE